MQIPLIDILSKATEQVPSLVLALGGIIYVVHRFLAHLKEDSIWKERDAKEQSQIMVMMSEKLEDNTAALSKNSVLMEDVKDFLEEIIHKPPCPLIIEHNKESHNG